MKIFRQFFIICLGISLIIGIVSNLFYPANISTSLIVIAICLIIGFCLPNFKHWANSLSQTTALKICYSIMGLIFIIQIIVLTFFPATVYHDPFRVLHEAELLSRNRPDWDNSTYFWRYSNNVSLTFFLSLWLKLTNIFHLSTNISLHLLALITVDSFIFLSFKSCQRFSKHSAKMLAIAAFFLFSPFAYTYYLQVYYTDLPILVILLLIFKLLADWPQKRSSQFINAVILFGLVVCGQLIKPNLIILAVAGLFLTFSLLLQQKKQSLKKLIIPLAVIGFAFAAAFPASSAVNAVSGFKANNRYSFPLTHWVWMSYNPHDYGMYNTSDVEKMISLPSKTTRQKYLAKALPERLNSLGLGGILQQWVEKAAVSLNVSTLQVAYTGGFIQAPKFYLKWQLPVHILSQAIMRSSFIWLYLIGLSRCLFQLKYRSKLDSIRELAIILAVGYISFYTLIWEAESRYGQVLLPLLLIINTLPGYELRFTWKKSLTAKFGAIILCNLVILSNLISWHTATNQIIAAQRSQLSSQYHAKTSWLLPGKSVSQKIIFNHDINKFSVAVPPKAQITGKLVNDQTQQCYSLTSSGSYSGIIAAGSYHIFLRNNELRSQPIEITRTVNYRLTSAVVMINGQTAHFTSLIYKGIYKSESI
ncbi:hypothetical protein [Liquorilactobacillus nagelii]|uniref:hypothetical protein n=1 Tax=Liquorilactobacillus nagelii TaxID=82688 RepID=UPI001CCC0F6D|nr:hypothetical protein [Liquorilactobacillus nagelii]ULQ50237.1 hypothetical protein J6864_04220 [Liquorilactobacillus nagelii]